ncbi:ABC transporter permease [Geodermatophilus sp. CPCC 206100]|uniref:ABC transporter permease n=1 Tax=Geodermatophilus sp. CPCC 206100 TaxID=3020054 RepID=UPI003B006B2B
MSSALRPREQVDPAGSAAPAPTGSGTGGGGEARRRWLVRLLPWVTTAALLGVEEVLARTGVLPEEVPPFSEIVRAGWELVPTATFATSLGATVEQFAVGLLAGVAIGVALGVALGAIPLLYRLTHYVLDFLRFIPAVVYLPVLILVMGATPEMAYLLAAVGAVWPMLFQTYYGVAGIAPILGDTARVFGLKPHQRLLYIVLPAVSPFIATGLRIAASHVLVVVVAVEIITGVEGLGRDISVFATNGVYPEMYALVGMVGVIGVLVNVVLERVERRQLHWHSSHRGRQV